MLEHRAENTEQLAHTGYQPHFLGLAGFQDPLIAGLGAHYTPASDSRHG